MMPSSAVKKRMKQERDIDDMDIAERRGWVNFVIGRVKKEGRENVLSCEKDRIGPDGKLYWLKKQYEKLIDHAQEARIKKIPLKMAGVDKEGNTVPLVCYLPEVRKSET